jgi:hypothetical protein
LLATRGLAGMAVAGHAAGGLAVAGPLPAWLGDGTLAGPRRIAAWFPVRPMGRLDRCLHALQQGVG